MPQQLDLQRYDTLTPQLDLQPYGGNDWQGPIQQEPQRRGFVQGLLDVPEEMYKYVSTAGKTAAEQIGQGNYGGAFHSIFAPVTDPFQGIINADLNFAQGKPFGQTLPGFETPEQSKNVAKSQLLGAAGFPAEGFEEAWQSSDYPRIAGQAIGAALTMGGLHGLGKISRAGVAEPNLDTSYIRDPRQYTQSYRPELSEYNDIYPDYSFADGPKAPKSPVVDTPPVGRQTHFDGEIPFTPGEDIPVPAGMENNPEFAQNMEQNGYKFAGRTPDGQQSIFKQFLTEDKGEFDFDAMAAGGKEVWQSLKRRLGRDPSVVEMEEEAARIRGVVAPRTGEETGRIAGFPSQATNFYEYSQELSRLIDNPATPEIAIESTLSKGRQLIEGVKTASEAQTHLLEFVHLAEGERNPSKAEFYQQMIDDLAEKRNQLYEQENRGFGQIRPANEIRDQFIPDQPQLPTRTPPPPNQLPNVLASNQMDPRMAARVEAGGPREFDFTTPEPVQGQQTLPMIGALRENERMKLLADADYQRQLRQQAADQFTRRHFPQPEQGDMAGDLGDTIISEYLRNQGIDPSGRSDVFDKPSEARAPSAGQRIEALKQQMDEAYRRGDTREVVRIGQEINEIEQPIRMGQTSRGAQTPERAFRSDPRSKLPSDFQAGTWDAERRQAAKRAADENQAERARALGINPFFDNGLRKHSDYLAQEIYEARQKIDKPSEMQVRKGGYAGGGKVIINPDTGRPNLAMGGADPQVIRQLGQSLYTKDRPSVFIQESFQNTMDEYAISGITEPIRVSFNYDTANPTRGTSQNSIVFQDFGRGMNESQLYNEFSDVGKSGKRHIQGAAGGFGFAKAAPFLGGEYMRVESITMEDGNKVRYTFEGEPEQFLDQEVGVPLTQEILDDPYNPNYDKPTGMRVEVFFNKQKSFYNAGELLKTVSENSPSAKNIEFYKNYHSDNDTLDPNSYAAKFIKGGEQSLSSYERASYFEKYEGQPQPTRQADISLPDNDVKTYYEFDNKERPGTKVIYLNNGVFYHSRSFGASNFDLPHIPDRIIFDINTKVPEGHTNYPFPASREGINTTVDNELMRWYRNTIVKPAMDKYRAELIDIFDNLQPTGNRRHVILDSGEKYTPTELASVENSPTLNRLADIQGSLLEDLASYFQPDELVGDTVKYGYRLADEGKGGINIARPDTPGRGQHVILVNPFDSFRSGFSGAAQDLTPQQAARRFVHITMHEFVHNIARHEGSGFTWALSQAETRFERRAAYEAQVLQAITGGTGRYVAEIPQLLQQHLTARGRPESKVDVLSREGTSLETPDGGSSGATRSGRGNEPGIARRLLNEVGRLVTEEQGATPISDIWRATKRATGWGQGLVPKKKKGPDDYNFIEEAFKFPAAATTTGDLSPIGRQGLTMVLTPQFYKAIPKAFQSIPYSTWKRIDTDLRNRPLHRKTINPNTGQVNPSLAEKIGFRLYTPASEPGPRAEAVASRWLETGGFLGPKSAFGVPNVPRAAWYHTMGYPIRATGRFWIGFMNELRHNRLEYLMNRAQDMSIEALATGRAPMQGLLGGMQLPKFMGQVQVAPYTSRGYNIGLKRAYGQQEAMDLDPYRNLNLAKELVDFIDTATGQAPLKGHVLPFKQTEIDLSGASRILGAGLFSPGMLASRMRLLWAPTYMMATARVRREYIKAAMGAVLGWGAFTLLAKTAADALGQDNEINLDPTNADFGKFRIGDTRLDFGGGFLQFAVLIGRMLEGGWTSSSNPEEGMHRFGEGFNPETKWSNLWNFGTNKLNPAAKFAYDVMNASERQPFNIPDRTAQLFVNLFSQDLYETAQKNPELLGWMIPVLFGAGTQTYGRTKDYLGKGEYKFVPPDPNWTLTGGESPLPQPGTSEWLDQVLGR